MGEVLTWLDIAFCITQSATLPGLTVIITFVGEVVPQGVSLSPRDVGRQRASSRCCGYIRD